jgi:5-methylcytosine-specific restriction endonuclease McrA
MDANKHRGPGKCACGNNRESKGCDKNGNKRYGQKCTSCRKRADVNKLLMCELCGFVAVHPCQLDVDHIDGNHKNNRMSNLQTLCSNCHRLKTYRNKDWVHTPHVDDHPTLFS